MIGNTDWWIHRRHNVDLVELADGSLVPIPFDFDYAGIINTPYAIPSPSMPIKSVEDRFSRVHVSQPQAILKPFIPLYSSGKRYLQYLKTPPYWIKIQAQGCALYGKFIVHP
jgi:hypothetical protein